MAGGASTRLSRGRTAPPTPRELRSFALAVGGALLAVGGILAVRGRATAAAGLAALGAALVAGGLVAPARLGPVHRAWMAFALAISGVTTPVFMGIVYFGVLTPIALTMRLVGRRPLVRRPGAPTYWVERPAGARRSDLRRQF